MNLKIKPINNKFKALYHKHRYKVLYGGRSSGKSWAIVEALLYYAINYNVRVLCTREVQKSIEASSYQLIVDTIHRLEISEYFTIQRSKIICNTTGAVFTFAGLSDMTANSLKSTEGVDICWVEEAQTITQKSLTILLPTLRKKGSEIWFSFNPYMVTDPIYKRFVKGRDPRAVVIKINYTDNPTISQETLDEIEFDKKNPGLFKHIWLGECIESGDLSIIPSIILEQAYNRDVIHQPTYQVVAGLDVARSGGDKSVLLIRQGVEILAIYEWETNRINNDWIDEVINICAEYKVDEISVDADGLGAGAYDLLDEKKADMHMKVNEIRGGHVLKQTYFNLRTRLYFMAAEFLTEGIDGILPSLKSDNIDQEKLDRLYEELMVMTYLPNKQSGKLQATAKADIKKLIGRSPDYADAFIYSLSNFDDEKNATSNIETYKKVYGY